MKRVLIIRSGAVGDLILTLPVLSALKKRYSGLSIDMMGDPVRLSLLKHCGFVDDVLPVDDRDFTPLFSTHAAQADEPALCSLQSYDAIISYLPDITGVFEGNLRRIIPGLVLSGQVRPVADRRVHMTHLIINALVPLSINPVAEVPWLRLPDCSGSGQQDLPHPDRPSIAIHPGSGGPDKCWPAESYVTLIEALVDRGLEPVVTFGPADEKVRSRIATRVEGIGARIAENLNLADLSKLLNRCAAMIGNDSGITHLATALGVPVVALFGPTDPAVWGPRGKNVRILWGGEPIEGDVGAKARTDAFHARRLTDTTPGSVMNELANLRTSS